MNFEFGEEQNLLRDQARGFLTDNCPPSLVRRVLDSDELYAADLWQKIVEMGWLGAAIPEEYGGLGLGMLEMCVIAEELGRALAPVPFGSSAFFFAEAVKLAGSEEQKKALLPNVADGSLIGCIGASEGPGAVDAGHVNASFKDGALSGVKVPVTDGDIATHAIVLAKEGSGHSLVVVDLSGDGVTRTALGTIEPTRSHADVPRVQN